jgi:hypothetical protein
MSNSSYEGLISSSDKLQAGFVTKRAPTPEESMRARNIAGRIDRKHSFIFQRAGSQLYTDLDSVKDPYTNAYDAKKEYGKEFYIDTDGVVTLTHRVKDSQGGEQQHFSVEGYSYIIEVYVSYDAKGYIEYKKQFITIRRYEDKIFCQQFLSVPLG